MLVSVQKATERLSEQGFIVICRLKNVESMNIGCHNILQASSVVASHERPYDIYNVPGLVYHVLGP